MPLTPGPWKWIGRATSSILSGPSEVVAVVARMPYQEFQDEDKSVIRAAWEMYQALKMYQDREDNSHGTQYTWMEVDQAIRDAIKSAETIDPSELGRPRPDPEKGPISDEDA